MEKIVALLQRPDEISLDQFCHGLLQEVADLKSNGASNLRVCLADDAVVAARPYRILEAGPEIVAMVSFWLNSVRDVEFYLARLTTHDPQTFAYLVTESEPLTRQLKPGERAPSMNQVVTLKKPERLDYQTWLDIWLNEHTQLAIEIQASFGYRQNVVVRHLRRSQPDYATIVEENFPNVAMSSRPAFYEAEGNEQLYQEREQAMMDSASRMIDFDQINCIPMSEYNF